MHIVRNVHFDSNRHMGQECLFCTLTVLTTTRDGDNVRVADAISILLRHILWVILTLRKLNIYIPIHLDLLDFSTFCSHDGSMVFLFNHYVYCHALDEVVHD